MGLELTGTTECLTGAAYMYGRAMQEDHQIRDTAAAGTGNKPKEFFHHRWIEGVSDRFILNPDFRPPPQLNQETLLASGGASINDFRPLGTPERYCADSRALTKTCDPVPLLYFRSRNPHRFNAGTYQDNANQDNNDISNLEVNQ